MHNHAMRPPKSDIFANDAASEGQLDEDDEDEPPTEWAPRFSRTPRDAEPKATTMKFYPPGWQGMLEIAKNNMRKHVALVNGFPWRDRDLKEATLILNNSITEYLRIEGNTLEPGSLLFLFQVVKLQCNN